MQNRTPQWELHIRPMFNLMDNDHMGYLHDVDEVWSRRHQILGRLKARPGSMPPPTEHGPWPNEWTALFERWIEFGENELSNMPPRLGMATGSQFALQEEFGGLDLVCKAEVPDGETSRAYFLTRALTNRVQEFDLVLEVDGDSTGAMSTKDILAIINRTPNLAEIIVNHAGGVETLSTP